MAWEKKHRFLDHVSGNRRNIISDKIKNKTSEPNQTGCTIWTGNKNKHTGYGRIHIDHIKFPIHRVIYELTYGEIPAGLFVCHKCDNKLCINIEHLFLGTPNDNMQDMIKKGRQNYSTQTIHKDKYLKIAQLLRIGMPQSKIAKILNISQGTVTNLNTGKIKNYKECA